MREWLKTFGSWTAVGSVAMCLSFAIAKAGMYSYKWFGLTGLIITIVATGAVLSFRKS